MQSEVLHRIENISLNGSQDSVSIRNVCILAHVDHGKTTLADILLTMNNIIVRKNVGKIRYMDDRADEQERGITMKSSGVSLNYTVVEKTNGAQQNIQLNLIDTPGHIDFSSEVSAAVRVCDGAIIVVDVVEGMCSQTQAALHQAYTERLSMILVLNKIDRLILELKKTPLEVMLTLMRIIEDINAYIAELHRFDFARRIDEDIDFEEDEAPTFNPSDGNVIFASAIDGWGFNLLQIAQVFGKKLDLNPAQILKNLWNFNAYYDKKTKTICEGAVDKQKPSMFKCMVVDTICSLYETIVVKRQAEKLETILAVFEITKKTRDMTHNDPRVQLQAIASAWKPICSVLMNLIADVIPSPKEITECKVKHLLGLEFHTESNYIEKAAEYSKPFLKACSSSKDVPVIAYVSKTFCVSKKCLSQNKPKRLTQEELAARRAKIVADLEEARKRKETDLLQNQLQKSSISEGLLFDKSNFDEEEKKSNKNKRKKDKTGEEESIELQVDIKENYNMSDIKNQTVHVKEVKPIVEVEINEIPVAVIAFTRIFSGTLSIGQKLYILPKDFNSLEVEEFDSQEEYLKQNDKIKQVTITALYTLMGRELIYSESVTAGNVCGIGGLDNHIIRTGTLTNTLKCVPIVETCVAAEPMIRNAIEPKNPADMPVLRQALKHLVQSDSCLQVLVNEKGEYILLTAGDVHLAKILEDLKNNFTPIEVKLSPPMVSLRETVVHLENNENLDKPKECNIAEIEDYGFSVEIVCIPLPKSISMLIKEHITLLHMIEQHQTAHPSEMLQKIRKMTSVSCEDRNKYPPPDEKTFINQYTSKIVTDLKRLFEEVDLQDWSKYLSRIWSVGKSKDNMNLLINNDENYPYRCIYNKLDEFDIRSCFDNCVVNAFQMVCKSGPLCEEPLMDVAFLVQKFNCLNFDPNIHGSFSDVCAKITNVTREVCRKAVKQFGRLMEPIFTTDITVDSRVVGRVYNVVSKRHGKIRESLNIDETKKSVVVNAEIPVIESIGFCNEIRKCSSGKANPNLHFSHFELIPEDPFYSIVIIDEDEVDNSRAYKLLCDTRRRKGLVVDEQLVKRAEKQRTLNKKK